MNNFVNYKTHVLAKNSQAYELWQLAQKTGEYKLLDQHLKLVDTDGENKAVRALLMLYGEPGLTDGQLVWVVVAFIVLMLGLLTLRSCL